MRKIPGSLNCGCKSTTYLVTPPPTPSQPPASTTLFSGYSEAVGLMVKPPIPISGVVFRRVRVVSYWFLCVFLSQSDTVAFNRP